MDQLFPKGKIKITGNPVRKDILDLSGKKEMGQAHFGLDADRKTILVLGGSLGARTLNQAVLQDMQKLEEAGYQMLWQSGKFYFKEMQSKLEESGLKHIHLREFIREMDLAYAAADVIVSRAGALSVSELSLVGKPVIFIPSPNVAEDHQTKNAMAYVSHQAAVLLKDADAVGQLKIKVDELLQNAAFALTLGENMKKLAKPDAAKAIVNELEFLVK
jgi:UDP-N-acetylglucosamine--N-acetylmuramyl-(pentapeptide) pyrophosphoryl-undecaprenol N-acetylglucosamine transferase